MAREKTTITVDRTKLDQARRLTGSASASGTIDVALDALLRAERLRRDVEAYTAHPPTDDEAGLARRRAGVADLADDTDWEALYGRDG